MWNPYPPLPSERVRFEVMRMWWLDLFFIHFAYPPETVQALLPPDLVVDTWPGDDGTPQAWVALVPFEMTVGRLEPRLLQSPGEGSLVTAGETVQSCRMLLEELPVDPRLPFGPTAGGGSEQAAEIAIAVAVGDEKREAGLAEVRGPSLEPQVGGGLHHHLGAYDRLEIRLAGRLMETRGSIHTIAIQ